MKIYLVRHGKSDKNLKGKVSHELYELNRSLIDGEAEKAKLLGNKLRQEIGTSTTIELVHSEKLRSKQTVMAIGERLGLSDGEIQENLREDEGLTYRAEEEYWEDCEKSIEDGVVSSHAEYFLTHPPTSSTYTAEFMRANMRAAIKRAIERNSKNGFDACAMVSHEPVISLFLSDLTGLTVHELGGSCHELEYAVFEVNDINQQEIVLNYRDKKYSVGEKI